jgi:hypothetical protein
MKVSNQRPVPATLSWQRALAPTEYEAGWAPEPIQIFGRREKYEAPARFISQTCYTENITCINIYNTICTAQF